MLSEIIYWKISEIAPELSLEQKHKITLYALELVYQQRADAIDTNL